MSYLCFSTACELMLAEIIPKAMQNSLASIPALRFSTFFPHHFPQRARLKQPFFLSRMDRDMHFSTVSTTSTRESHYGFMLYL